MRRTYRETVAFSPLLRLGDLEIDIMNRRVRAGSTELHLTPLEQSLLLFAGSQRRPPADPRRNSRPAVGCRLRGGEQYCGPAHPQPTSQAAEPCAPWALHRHGSWPWLPVPPDSRRCCVASLHAVDSNRRFRRNWYAEAPREGRCMAATSHRHRRALSLPSKLRRTART
jgi:hypothetical protein